MISRIINRNPTRSRKKSLRRQRTRPSRTKRSQIPKSLLTRRKSRPRTKALKRRRPSRLMKLNKLTTSVRILRSPRKKLWLKRPRRILRRTNRSKKSYLRILLPKKRNRKSRLKTCPLRNWTSPSPRLRLLTSQSWRCSRLSCLPFPSQPTNSSSITLKPCTSKESSASRPVSRAAGSRS